MALQASKWLLWLKKATSPGPQNKGKKVASFFCPKTRNSIFVCGSNSHSEAHSGLREGWPLQASENPPVGSWWNGPSWVQKPGIPKIIGPKICSYHRTTVFKFQDCGFTQANTYWTVRGNWVPSCGFLQKEPYDQITKTLTHTVSTRQTFE